MEDLKFAIKLAIFEQHNRRGMKAIWFAIQVAFYHILST